MIDLRSDTVTKPTPAMREAMAKAEVGDDVFGEDPTVNRLQENVAALLGKEAGLFMVSGSMSNQVAVKTHTQPGDEVILDKEAHICVYECGTPAAFSGVMLNTIAGKNGFFTAEETEQAVRPVNVHHPRTRLVSMENTHNRAGGTVCPLGLIEEVHAVAERHGLAMHLDGARLWNACAATGIAERDYAAHFDSLSVCFSKGLGAPVGSCLAGSGEFIARARRFRKMFGGGMRQAGIIAAGALYALEHHRGRLAEDHANAKALAEGVARLPGIELNIADVETNIVIFRVTSMPAAQLVGELAKRGVAMMPTGPDTVRAVLCLEVNGEQVRETIGILRGIVGA